MRSGPALVAILCRFFARKLTEDIPLVFEEKLWTRNPQRQRRIELD